MKRTLLILLIAFTFNSCDSLTELLEFNVDNDLTENISVSVLQTQGNARDFNLSETTDLNSGELAQYRDKITAVKINKFTYKIKDFVGNSSGELVAGSLKFNDLTITSFADFNISSAATAGTVFEITDTDIISSVENAFLNNNSATLSFVGTVLSNEGPMDFNVEVFMSMTATIKD